jgi:hypothetical protein
MNEICHRGGGENSFAGGTQQHHVPAVPEILHTVGKKGWTIVLPPVESILKGIKCLFSKRK